jgi:hypothetical protein
MTAKVTRDLEFLTDEADPAEPIEVIVQVRVPPADEAAASRAARVAARRARFEESARSVEAAIGDLRGRTLERAWLNGSLRALVPAGRITDLAGRADVESIDVPHPLEAERA